MIKKKALPVSKKKFIKYIDQFISDYNIKHGKLPSLGTYYIKNVPIEIREKNFSP